MSSTNQPKIPIRAKILGLSLLLSTLLSAGVAVEYIASVRADRRLDFLAEAILPLDKIIADARAFSLSESLQIERTRNNPPDAAIPYETLMSEGSRLDLGNCNADEVRRALNAIQVKYPHSGTRHLVDLGLLRDCFVIKMRAAIKLAAATQITSFTDDPTAIDAMASIRQNLAEIALAHAELYRAADAMFSGRNDSDLANYLRNDVARRRSSIQRMLASALDSAQAAAHSNAANARRLSAIARQISLVVTAVSLLIALILSILLSRQLTRPLLDLLSRANLLRAGDLSVRVQPKTRDEIALLSSAFNEMADSLERDAAARRAFGKYLDPRVVARIVEEGRTDAPTRRKVAVSFCDLASFTSISEALPTDALARLLERYFSLMCAPVHASGGVVDKFIGDAVMSFWAPPFCEEAELSRHACETILAQMRAIDTLQMELPDLIGSRFLVRSVSARFVASYGEAVVGSIGAEQAKGFTVIGDTVNLASRLEGVAKFMGVPCAVSNAIREHAHDAFVFRELGLFRVVGRSEAEPVFELLMEKSAEGAAAALEYSQHFAEAMTLMRTRRFSEAGAAFSACLALRRDDSAAGRMIEYCNALAVAPPAAEWNGVLELDSK